MMRLKRRRKRGAQAPGIEFRVRKPGNEGHKRQIYFLRPPGIENSMMPQTYSYSLQALRMLIALCESIDLIGPCRGCNAGHVLTLFAAGLGGPRRSSTMLILTRTLTRSSRNTSCKPRPTRGMPTRTRTSGGEADPGREVLPHSHALPNVECVSCLYIQ